MSFWRQFLVVVPYPISEHDNWAEPFVPNAPFLQKLAQARWKYGQSMILLQNYLAIIVK